MPNSRSTNRIYQSRNLPVFYGAAAASTAALLTLSEEHSAEGKRKGFMIPDAPSRMTLNYPFRDHSQDSVRSVHFEIPLNATVPATPSLGSCDPS